MENKENTKKVWTTPVIFDLDVDRTKSGDIATAEVGSSNAPPS